MTQKKKKEENKTKHKTNHSFEQEPAFAMQLYDENKQKRKKMNCFFFCSFFVKSRFKAVIKVFIKLPALLQLHTLAW